jgi:hypothetical protein
MESPGQDPNVYALRFRRETPGTVTRENLSFANGTGTAAPRQEGY